MRESALEHLVAIWPLAFGRHRSIRASYELSDSAQTENVPIIKVSKMRLILTSERAESVQSVPHMARWDTRNQPDHTDGRTEPGES